MEQIEEKEEGIEEGKKKKKKKKKVGNGMKRDAPHITSLHNSALQVLPEMYASIPVTQSCLASQ